MRRLWVLIAVVAFAALTPSIARAQSAIAGVVKDTTGASMPGVTVEAASPVLIEKVRSAVTDQAGAYRIENIFPGVYTVTFTVQGFNAFVQSGIDLPSNFTATVNADMKLSALAESVTIRTRSKPDASKESQHGRRRTATER